MRYENPISFEGTENTVTCENSGDSGRKKITVGSLGHRVKRLLWKGMEKESGIDGILVTVGLCIIALLLCVVMKDSLQTFIETIVTAMTTEAQKILTGVSG